MKEAGNVYIPDLRQKTQRSDFPVKGYKTQETFEVQTDTENKIHYEKENVGRGKKIYSQKKKKTEKFKN
jgi:hypothetical protein